LIWLILGIILGLCLILPEGDGQPSTKVEIETTVREISLLDELEEWDTQDHIEELAEEEEE